MGAPFTAIRLSLFCFLTPHEAIFPISFLFLFLYALCLSLTHTQVRKASALPAIGSHRRAILVSSLPTYSPTLPVVMFMHVPVIIKNNILKIICW